MGSEEPEGQVPPSPCGLRASLFAIASSRGLSRSRAVCLVWRSKGRRSRSCRLLKAWGLSQCHVRIVFQCPT